MKLSKHSKSFLTYQRAASSFVSLFFKLWSLFNSFLLSRFSGPLRAKLLSTSSMAFSTSFVTLSISAVRRALAAAGDSSAAAASSAVAASFDSSLAGAGVGASAPKLMDDWDGCALVAAEACA